MIILVVDDNKKSRDRLQKMLVKDGHEVVTASNGIDAFHAYEDNNIDVAFIDWTMPRMSGAELCMRIRDYNLKTSRISYLVLVSGKTEKHDMVEGLDAGVDDFIIRPYSQSVIRSRLNVAERVLQTKKNKIPKVQPLKDIETEPVAILNREHAMVRKITGILEVVANMLGEGRPLPKKLIRWVTSSAFIVHWQLHEEKEMYYIDLFMVRAQDIHGKTAQIYSRSSLAQILKEHELIKTLLNEMQAAVKNYNIDNKKSALKMRELFLRYISLARFHAAREEDVFLPFSQRYLTDADISKLLEDFKRIDSEVGTDTITSRMNTIKQLERILKIKEKVV